MLISRRFLLAVAAAGSLDSGLVPQRAWADEDPRRTERSFGHPDAHFANAVMPQVTKELVDTGKLRFVYRDFPLDQVALTAAMVARALPAAEYEPFIATLFASQDRWAFARGADTIAELSKLAALAGLSQDTFNATIADTALRAWIVAQQTADQKKYGIDSTPTFLIGGKTHPGALEYDEFSKLVAAVS